MPDRSPRTSSPSGGPDRQRAQRVRRGPAGGGRVRQGSTRTTGRPKQGSERPAHAARARTKPPEPPSQSTTWVRGAILLGIVVMLAVTLVPTLRSVIQQSNDTVALQERVERQRLTVEELKKQAALWEDPRYIEEQARERLRFVRVGDRAYSVTGLESQRSKDQSVQEPVVAAPMANDSAPWYGKVWQSIQIADRPTAGLSR